MIIINDQRIIYKHFLLKWNLPDSFWSLIAFKICWQANKGWSFNDTHWLALFAKPIALSLKMPPQTVCTVDFHIGTDTPTQLPGGFLDWPLLAELPHWQGCREQDRNAGGVNIWVLGSCRATVRCRDGQLGPDAGWPIAVSFSSLPLSLSFSFSLSLTVRLSR